MRGGLTQSRHVAGGAQHQPDHELAVRGGCDQDVLELTPPGSDVVRGQVQRGDEARQHGMFQHIREIAGMVDVAIVHLAS